MSQTAELREDAEAPKPEMTKQQSAFDRFFEITTRGSTVPREIRGGIVTFVTMAALYFVRGPVEALLAG